MKALQSKPQHFLQIFVASFICPPLCRPNGWIKKQKQKNNNKKKPKKTVTYAIISPKMVNPRDTAGERRRRRRRMVNPRDITEERRRRR